MVKFLWIGVQDYIVFSTKVAKVAMDVQPPIQIVSQLSQVLTHPHVAEKYLCIPFRSVDLCSYLPVPEGMEINASYLHQPQKSYCGG